MMDNEAILESISDGVFTVDASFRITYMNRSAEQIIKIHRQEALGRLCCDVFRSNLCEGACALRRTLSAGKPVIDLSCFIIDNEGCRIPVSISTAVLRNERGEVIGGAETFRNLSDLETLRKEIKGGYQLGDLYSHSPSMQGLFSQLRAVAETSATVLITGETGTGKEVLARTIHSLSPRKDKPFVAINCGAFPDTLLESELFGYKKGAFTGADRDKPGRFALAEGGTLFLDEIGEISPAMQVRLLRVLQERTYEPLGAVKPMKTHVRILAATNRDLEALVKEGTFRQDLYYRIHVVHLQLPALRERREDIPFLVEAFIRKFNATMNRSIRGISARALRYLRGREWPGNIRELENAIEGAMVFCGGDMLDAQDFLEEGNQQVRKSKGNGGMREAVRDSERQAIEDALKAAEGNRRRAAQMLGINHTTLYRKMKRLKMTLTGPDGRNKCSENAPEA